MTTCTSSPSTSSSALPNLQYPVLSTDPFVYNGQDKVPKDVTSVIFDPSVTEINPYSFKDCQSLTSLTLPQSVTAIGDYAFYDCTNLQYIVFPNTLKDIGNAAFDGCTSLTCVVLPESISKIRYRAFYRCTSLIAVFLPQSSVKSVRNNSFSDCTNLVLVCIPKSVRKVLYSAFDNCESLKKGETKTEVQSGFNQQGEEGEDSADDVGEEDLDLESWLQVRFDKLPIHELCYFYAAVRASVNVNNCNRDNKRDTATFTSQQLPSSVFGTKVQSLIRDNPDMLQATDALGMNPLHILACYCTNKSTNDFNNSDLYGESFSSDFIPQIMNEMIDACPILTEQKNRNGMTPLDLYIKCCFCRFAPPPLSEEEENTKTDLIASKMSEINMNTDANLNTTKNRTNYQSENCLPLCLLIKMGMGWKDIQRIIQICPNAALERGLATPMTRVTTLQQHDCDETSSNVINDEFSERKNADSDLYPFMQAAVNGDLELAYNLAKLRIDLLSQ